MGVLETLDSFSRALEKPDKLAVIGGMAVEMIRSHIHQGKGFAPLSPATEAYRGAGRPLQDLGGLRDSITYKVIDGQTVSVGTSKPYAAIQNFGGVIRPKNKEWLWLPAAGVRKLQRKYGYGISDVINGLRSAGYSLFRRGRTMCYKGKRRVRNAEGKLEYEIHVLYYLKKSVEIPARRFFFLTTQEMGLLIKEAGIDLEQL